MAYTHFAQIHPAAFPWPPMHRQFATAEPARQTILGAMRYGSNRLRTTYGKRTLACVNAVSAMTLAQVST
jgi:hypothetical protein